MLIGNLDGHVGNELLIANDTQPNSLFVRRPSGNEAGKEPLADEAQLRGCAVGLRGEPGGSMGIAAGDFDRNGRIDFHVTNFANEPCDLFLQSEDGFFTNALVRYGLESLSVPMVGWGNSSR